tara:strand:- start:44622 stop:45371 length:750 start_codon:yes stop_codon:yes gene_type:complete
MSDNNEFEFSIDALSPDTLSMKRLAEYLKPLAAVMGQADSVCFRRVEEGSALLKQDVLNTKAAIKVAHRIRAVGQGEAPAEASKAYKELNKLLKQDGAIGRLRATGSIAVNADLYFPGREEVEPPEFNVIHEAGALDGVLIQIGGKDDSVPVHIQHGLGSDGVYKCTCSRDLARQLAPLLFSEIRVEGVGDWKRDRDGTWQCKRFEIESFKPLTKTTVTKALRELGQAIGEDIQSLDNPGEFFKDMRED